MNTDDNERDIDWCGHMPTAPHGPVTLTADQVRAQLAQANTNEPQERTYDRIVLGRPHAWQAF